MISYLLVRTGPNRNRGTEPMVKTTRAQRIALLKLYNRTDKTRTYRDFRKTVLATYYMGGTVMVPFHSMWVGIEPDGYAHS